MKNKTLSVLAVAAALFCSSSAMAEDFKSAKFAFTGDQLLEKVESSTIAGSAVLYCRADINVTGMADRASCYTNANTAELVTQTESALRALPFASAVVEDVNVPVRMSFRVAFNRLDDATRVTLIPNLGTMQAQYGRDYVAPQERLDVSDWYERYTANSWVGGQEFLGEGSMSRVAATVNASGKPAMLKTVEAERAYARDANVVKVSLKDTRFIPGTVDGKVVPMQYMVAVHYEGAASNVADR
jgi:hypothetical protein